MKFLKKHYRKLIFGALSLLIILITFNSIKSRRYQNPEIFNPQKDKVVQAQNKDISSGLTLSASIKASQIASIHFQNPGKLVWLGVKEGDRVKKYQAIASLDKEQLRKSLQSQFNNYRTQLSQFWDVQDKYKDTVVTDTIQRILNRTQYSLDNSVINYEISDMAIKEATIVSPFSGVVVEADQSLVGTNITPTTSFTIINPDSIYLRAEVDQEDVTKIKIGQEATLSIDSYPDQKIDSQITYIAFTPVDGESSVVYEVRFKLPLDNSNLNYRYGMDASATITLAEAKNVLTVPLDALNNEDGKNFVWIKNNDRLSKVYVSTGIESDTDIQILEGLNPNDSVVIKQL